MYKKQETIEVTKHERITIHDIARIAGVASSTVSLALRDSPMVKEETRAKIQALARGFGYTPNHIARKLVMQNSELIGLLIPEISNAYFSELVENVESTIRQEGYHIILGITGRDIGAERELIENFQSKQTVEGFMICSAQEDPEWPLVESLKRTGTPFVFLGPEAGGNVDFVAADDVLGAEKIVSHLTGLGHRKIAFVGGTVRVRGVNSRLEGYKNALLKSDSVFTPELIISTDKTTCEDGRIAAQKFLALHNRPTAVFVVNDWMAIGFMFELLRNRIRIPEDIAIVGYDNIEMSKQLPIPLTTVDYDNKKITQTATEILFEYIKHKRDFRDSFEKKQIFIEPQVIIRQSCGSHLTSK